MTSVSPLDPARSWRVPAHSPTPLDNPLEENA
jgi:hypothetical protein